MNSVSLIGNIGKDVELRYTPAGKAVANISIAVKGRSPDAEWYDVVVWEKTAETLSQYCKKGSKVGINGRLQVRSWQDNAGNTRKSVEIVCTDLTLIGGNPDGQGQQRGQGQQNPRPKPVQDDTDYENLPF